MRTCVHLIVCDPLYGHYTAAFPTSLKRKTGVFKFQRFEETSRKVPFLLRISVVGKISKQKF